MTFFQSIQLGILYKIGSEKNLMMRYTYTEGNDMIPSKLIHRSKDILGGAPVFCGTRVPVQSFIDYLEEGKSLDEFLDDFPSVNRKQAIGMLEEIKRDILGDLHERAA